MRSHAGRRAREFMGREAELRKIADLLRDGVQMITLIGPGGVGKTTLAERALDEQSGVPKAEVHWSRLADVARGSDIESVAAHVLWSITGAPCSGRPAGAELVRLLRATPGERMVLVLDSCEHVLAGVSGLVAQLIDAVPAVTIIATSRENVGWVDEYLVAVPPLSTPDAVEVLHRRAARIGRPLRGDPAEHIVASRICRAVDNNPLFVRLAADRLQHLPPTGVLNELTGADDDRRLRWPRGAVAGTDPRHRGIRDAIAWSYQLCDIPERALLERMSVFATGATEAAETPRFGVGPAAVAAVCSGDGVLAVDQVPGLLERLADKSLVGMCITATAVRYHLTGSVRLFAWERLNAAGPDRANRLRRGHRRYYRDGLRTVRDTGKGPDGRDGVPWVRAALGEIISAVETSLSAAAEAMVGLEIATTLLSVLSSAEKTTADLVSAASWAESTSALAAGDYELARASFRQFALDHAHPGGECAVPASPPPAWSRWDELTPAETEVALLAAAGWANREIAVRRGASVRTVDAQLAAVRHKLMIASRGEIARHVPGEIAPRMRHESSTRPRA
ncbi:ATP-binding protein [Nocardia rhamnosiphila]